MPVLIDVAPGLEAAVDLDQVRADGERILAAAERAAAELSVLLTDDRTMQQHNRDWRGKDVTTDVLSFPQDTVGAPVDVLGDVIVNVELAVRQGQERGHGTLTELRVLLVHGVAHLLGHDHHGDAEAAAMRQVERRLLRAVFGDDAPAGMVEAALGG